MPILDYNAIKAGAAKDLPASDAGTGAAGSGGEGVSGTFTGQVTIEVPQLPAIQFPMEDYTFQSTITGKVQTIDKLLSIKAGSGGKQNDYAGSQVLINSDRIILNSRTNYLMLFGKEGIAISSQGNVNIDAEDAVTIYGEDGLFLGVPGKGEAKGNKDDQPKTKADLTLDNDYEPLVLGTKLANLLEDLLIILKNATLLTPVGKGYFREDVMYEFACLQARIPEMLSTFGYIDGISHEPVDPAPEPPKTVTEPPTTLTGTVTGTFTGTTTGVDPNAATTQITNPLADQPDFFEPVSLYGDGL
jgi:hypothetical protein